MDKDDDEIIRKRFFNAVDRCISDKKIRGRQTFTAAFGINKRNFYTAKDEEYSGRFKTTWIAYLYRKCGVSLKYLMTGDGEFYEAEEKAKMRTEIGKSLQEDINNIINS